MAQRFASVHGPLHGLRLAISTWTIVPWPCDWACGQRYAFVFLPLVGALVGAAFAITQALLLALKVAALGRTLLSLFVVVWFTGGIHLDGYIDLADAVSSHRDVATKRAILKDPHIGAFALIRLASLGLVSIGLLVSAPRSTLPFVAAGFVVSRTAAALTPAFIPLASSTGMLASLRPSHGQTRIVIAFAGLLTIALALAFWRETLCLLVLICVGSWWYRRHLIVHLGGLNGDGCGAFIVICDLFVWISAVVPSWLAIAFCAT